MKRLFKIASALFLMLMFHQQSYAQTKGADKIAFKDYHSTNILDIQLSQDGKYILTSDEDGKVLMYNTETFDFMKTVKSPGIVPVSGMQLVRNDSVLMMSQRYSTSYRPEFDSLLVQNIYADTIFNKQQLSFQVIDLDIDGCFGVLTQDQDGARSLNVFNANLEIKINFAFDIINYPAKVGLSHDFSKMAYQSDFKKDNIVVVDLSAAEQRRDTIATPKGENVLSLFFDRETHELFALMSIVGDDRQEVKIYNLSAGSFGTPIYTVDYWASALDRIVSKYDGERHLLVIVNGIPLGNSPLLILRDSLDFAHRLIDIPKGATDAVVNTVKNEIYFVNQSTFDNVRDLSVYNYEERMLTGTFPKLTRGFYTCAFLPDGSWAASAGEGAGNGFNTRSAYIDTNQDIKYFELGTFNNRFGALGLKDYLEVKHHVLSYSANLYPSKGIAVLYGSGKDMGEAGYYRYDFANDEITQLTDIRLSVVGLQDYNMEEHLLLLADGYYHNRGHTKSIKFELIKNDQIIPLDGDYKFGRFSNNGMYLLTISEDNLLEIKNIETLKIIHTKQLVEGDYTVHAVDESDFFVSNNFIVRNQDKCNQETHGFGIKENVVTVTDIPCAIINDISYVDKNTGFIFDNIGVVINGTVLRFTRSDFPTYISFNQDGSKFILSLKNGKNVIYDTSSLKPVGYMIHPDSKTHIFYDENNNYFSNTDPEQFLYAIKDGNNVPLRQVQNEFFNPEEILRLFGTPNSSYLTALQKAVELRNANYVADEQLVYEQTSSSLTVIDSLQRPSLYLLSIGVSDYQDDAYSLTFSDKDAIDMAKIYGKLDEQQTRTYYDKFFGTKYTVYNQDKEPVGTINKYTAGYKPSEEKHLLSPDGNIWLHHTYGKYAIWDYKGKTIDSLQLPEMETWGSLVRLEEKIFMKPDSTGFYLKGKNGFFEYLFETKKFTSVVLPFEPSKENFVPLTNNRWLHFDHKNQEIVVSLGAINSDKADTKHTVSPIEEEYSYRTKINFVKADGTVLADTLSLGYVIFKSASPDGRYVFFYTGSYSEAGNIFFLDLAQNEIIPTFIDVQLKNTYDIVSIDSKEERFAIVEDSDDLEKRFVAYYDLRGAKIDSSTFKRQYGGEGVASNGKFYYINEGDGLLSKTTFGWSTVDTDHTLEKSDPYTFDKVHMEYLVNDGADAESIKQRLQTFFDKAAPEDQVMVFLAGHGVLDSKNNYYFAPYDMDFDDVDKCGVSFETIVQSLQRSPAQNKLLLMDTCHSGKTIDLEEDSEDTHHKEHRQGDRGSAVVSRTTPPYKVSDVISNLFEDFLSTSGVTIISASSGGDLAQEHTDWGNGAFTSAYIKVLKSKMAGAWSTIRLNEEETKRTITLDDSFINELYKEVVGLTNGVQTPDLRELSKEARIYLW